MKISFFEDDSAICTWGAFSIPTGPEIGCPKTLFLAQILCPVFGPGHFALKAQNFWVLDSDTEVQKVGKAARPF